MDKVRIGGTIYSIEFVDDLRDGDKKLDGQILHSSSQILIEASLDEQARDVTLWHEILHGILTNAGRRKRSEGIVSTLAYGVRQALKDNPELVKLC